VAFCALAAGALLFVLARWRDDRQDDAAA